MVGVSGGEVAADALDVDEHCAESGDDRLSPPTPCVVLVTVASAWRCMRVERRVPGPLDGC